MKRGKKVDLLCRAKFKETNTAARDVLREVSAHFQSHVDRQIMAIDSVIEFTIEAILLLWDPAA